MFIFAALRCYIHCLYIQLHICVTARHNKWIDVSIISQSSEIISLASGSARWRWHTSAAAARAILSPLWWSAYDSWHSQLRTGELYWSKVLLPVCPCWRQLLYLVWIKETLEFSWTVLSTLSLYH